jgi:hypothetical protein
VLKILVDSNVAIVDQKTALGNQVLGSYEELDTDALLLASVRTMERQGFKLGNIQCFKKSLFAEEGDGGFLKFFENKRTKTGA